MASEKEIKRILDLCTSAPKARIESLGFAKRGRARSMRRVVKTKNVVAMGIAEKITNGKRTGKLALTFYVERKISPKKLLASEAVPPTVPEALSGPNAIPTDVIVLGKMRPEINATKKPLQPGNSIGHETIGSTGTFGAVVTKGGAFHVLSNSHVLALNGLAKKGDAIIYPGDADGGEMPKSLVAKLSGFKKFKGSDFVNRVDCAIAKLTDERLADLVSEIKGLSFPKGTIKPVRGMKVTKVGRTTGRTTGEIRDVNFRFVLDYEGDIGEVGFIEQVLCTRYTDRGDSGSLVIDKATGRAVGLHFAGAAGGSVFNPIDEVLKALGCKLVTKAIKPKSKGKKKSAK